MSNNKVKTSSFVNARKSCYSIIFDKYSISIGTKGKNCPDGPSKNKFQQYKPWFQLLLPDS